MAIDRNVTMVLAGHPEHYTLPAEVVAAHEAIAALTEARSRTHKARTLADAAEREAIARTGAQLVALATAGKPLPAAPGQAVVDAQAVHALEAASLRAYAVAIPAAERALRGTLNRSTEAIILQALRPALIEVVAGIRELVPVLQGVDLSDTEAILRRPATAAAYSEAVALDDRYAAIRTARLGLYRLTSTGRPSDRAEIKNLHIVGPVGHLEGAARLLELVRRKAELWLPLPDELERAETQRYVHPRVEVPGTRSGGVQKKGVPIEA